MPGFLYYLPGLTHAAQRDEIAARVPHALAPKPQVKNECQRGPDDGAGLLASDPARTPADRLGYYPDRQEWRKAPLSRSQTGCGDFWVGWYRDEPPTPAGLARKDQLAGHLVQLGDGRDWLCPVARAIREGDGQLHVLRAVPGAATLDDEGRWTAGEVQAKYRRLWQIATDYAGVFFDAAPADGGVAFEFDDHDAQQNAVECLQVNYAVGPVEVAALGLLDDQLYKAVQILQAAIDWPAYQAWLKKKLAETAASIPAG